MNYRIMSLHLPLSSPFSPPLSSSITHMILYSSHLCTYVFHFRINKFINLHPLISFILQYLFVFLSFLSLLITLSSSFSLLFFSPFSCCVSLPSLSPFCSYSLTHNFSSFYYRAFSSLHSLFSFSLYSL